MSEPQLGPQDEHLAPVTQELPMVAEEDEDTVGDVSDEESETDPVEPADVNTWWKFMLEGFAFNRTPEKQATPLNQLLLDLASFWKNMPEDQRPEAKKVLRKESDGKIHWTAFMREGHKRNSALPVPKSPSEVLELVSKEWALVPEEYTCKEVRGKRKRSSFSPGESLKLHRGETLDAFNGARDKLEVYRMAGQIMTKKSEGKHRERYILPITQEKRQHMLRLVRAADHMIQNGTVKTLYDGLSLGFSIPYSLMSHEA